MKFQNRVLECINTFSPDMIYFDDTVLPFYGCDDAMGQNILAHYYNTSARRNGGVQQVVITSLQVCLHLQDQLRQDGRRKS